MGQGLGDNCAKLVDIRYLSQQYNKFTCAIYIYVTQQRAAVLVGRLVGKAKYAKQTLCVHELAHACWQYVAIDAPFEIRHNMVSFVKCSFIETRKQKWFRLSKSMFVFSYKISTFHSKAICLHHVALVIWGCF